ncbi:MAG: hypothetical protein ACTHU0_11215 [Kofleriaceae bacterium]
MLLDADVNAHTLLGMRWQDLAARAAFGAGIAAIPVEAPDGWRVVRAQLAGAPGRVALELMPGAAWTDGLLVELPGTPGQSSNLVATTLQPPPPDLGAPGTRDAVVLEVWRRSLNGYQVPAELLEPALGGPDTAERVETAYALRLHRMHAGDTCRSILPALRDDLGRHGRLHATLAPTTTTTGDCPVILGGGYTGFEHDLYRVEIAEVDGGAPMFKWSQWNGGLAGRGIYDAATQRLALIAGDQPILRSGLTSFYLEVLVLDGELGGWRVAYGARASLDASGEIDLSGPKSFGALPPATGSWFVRVWNDLRAVAEFPAGAPTELRDGIRLEFEPGPAGYLPGDYWTFPVRAGGLDNPSPLLDRAAPHGVHRHRVPLAELHWAAGPLSPGSGIEDCRVPLPPLTARDGCCTHTVGDGVTSHGDFPTIQAAIDALPAAGGRVCVLPGEYRENVLVKYRQAVEIVGCGPRSRLIAAQRDEGRVPPALHVLDTSGIRIRELRVDAAPGGIAILLEADELAGTTEIDTGARTPMLEDIHVLDCLVQATTGSGIEIRGGRGVEIARNRLLVEDQPNEWAAITAHVQDARIARNRVEVVGPERELERRALGGIWLRGGCARVEVDDNEIVGGAGHGVMLGHAEQSAATEGPFVLRVARGFHGYILQGRLDAACAGCGPGTVVVAPPGATDEPPWVAGAALRDIRIRRNEIRGMGMSGIGVFGFFASPDQGVISVENLEITGNRLTDNLVRPLAALPGGPRTIAGYGAISLADVVELVLRDNELVHNGTRTSGPVCAIFVLTAEGLELSRNRIAGNGPIGFQDISSSWPHGAIWLDTVSAPISAADRAAPRGRIAAGIRDNEVHAANGPALVMRALGHVQVIANAFTSESAQGFNNTTTVFITSYSLGSNLTTNATFDRLRSGLVKPREVRRTMSLAGRPIDERPVTIAEVASTRMSIVRPSRGAEAAYLAPPGSVLFSGNHCILEAPDAPEVASSVAIVGLDDIEVSGNHVQTTARAINYPMVVLGAAVRLEGNRFVDFVATAWSALAHGVFANATGNIADHCLLVSGSSGLVKANNLEIDSSACHLVSAFPAALGLVTVGGHS